MPIHSVIVEVSLATLAASYLAFVIAGFTRRFWWGAGNALFLPMTAVPFSVLHWRRARYGVGLLALSVLLFAAAIVTQYLTVTDTVLIRPDLGYEFTQPANWYPRVGEVKGAEVHISQLVDDMNFAVSKVAPSIGITKAADRVASYLATRLGVPKPSPRGFTLNGAAARDFRLSGCAEGRCTTWLVTAVQGPSRAVLLLAWTGSADQDELLPQLAAVRDSFTWLPIPASASSLPAASPAKPSSQRTPLGHPPGGVR